MYPFQTQGDNMQEVSKTSVVDKLLKRTPSPLPAVVTDDKTPEPQDAAEVLAKELKENIDYLLMAYKKGDKKRVMFRVGQIARQFVILGRMCAEFPEAEIVIPNKGIIV